MLMVRTSKEAFLMTDSEKTTSRFRTVDLAYIALFAVLMAVCAGSTVPMTVPFTLQSFAVFAALYALAYKLTGNAYYHIVADNKE